MKFKEWLKMEASIPYDPKIDVKKSAGGWQGSPPKKLRKKYPQ